MTGAALEVTSGRRDPVALFLIHDLRLGGAERALLAYVNHLRCIRPVVVVLRPRGTLLHELAPSVPVFDLESRVLPGSGDARSVFRDDADDRADAHTSPQGWSDDVVSLARKAARLRTIIGHTGASLVSSFLHKSHVLALASRIGGRRHVHLVANVHELVSRHLVHHHGVRDRMLLRRFIRHGLPRFDRVVAVSEGVRRDLVGEFGLPVRRLTVHHTPLDIHRVRSAAREPVELPFPRDPRESLVVAVGRLVHLKGFDVLLRAFAMLRSPPHVRLVIVGQGEEEPKLTAMIDALGVGDRVAMVGRRDNPWPLMAAADVVVLSSRTEAFPTVLGEAMALGRAVIASDCGPGVGEYLDGDRCGVLVPPEDPGALAAALERVLADGSLRRRLSQAGVRRVAAFELTGAVRRYEDMLLEVAAAQPTTFSPVSVDR